jgi:hypothetical protein
MNFIKETCMIVMDNKIISLNEGTENSVEFDFFTAWEYYKKYKPLNMHMIHTHPDNYLKTSPIDENMVKGWSLAFPIPIYYSILSKLGKNSLFYSSITYLVYKKFILPIGVLKDNKSLLNLYGWSCNIDECKDILQKMKESNYIISLNEDIKIL